MRPYTIRFPPDIASALRREAARTGKSHSELVRDIISREMGRREGRCPACGHRPEADSEDVTSRRRQVLARDGWRMP